MGLSVLPRAALSIDRCTKSEPRVRAGGCRRGTVLVAATYRGGLARWEMKKEKDHPAERQQTKSDMKRNRAARVKQHRNTVKEEAGHTNHGERRSRAGGGVGWGAFANVQPLLMVLLPSLSNESYRKSYTKKYVPSKTRRQLDVHTRSNTAYIRLQQPLHIRKNLQPRKLPTTHPGRVNNALHGTPCTAQQ